MKDNGIDIIHYEKAIAEKYGDEAVQNPRANWTPEKEKEYLASQPMYASRFPFWIERKKIRSYDQGSRQSFLVRHACFLV